MSQDMNVKEPQAEETRDYENISLEELMGRLQEIMMKLENPLGTLEESFKTYQDGMYILKACNQKIDDVEKKMIVLQEEYSHPE